MTILTIKVPHGKATDVYKYVKNIGGEVISDQLQANETEEDDDEVTHESYFGENTKKAMKAFKS